MCGAVRFDHLIADKERKLPRLIFILVNCPRWGGTAVNRSAPGSNPGTRANMLLSSNGRTPPSQGGGPGSTPGSSSITHT